jgi:hypothetical protein
MKNFDWSLLDRKSLINIFWSLRDQIVGKTYPINEIQSIFSRHLKKHLPIKVSKSTGTDVEFGWVYIGGTYYGDHDQDFKKCIEIVFVYNPFDEKVTLGPITFRHMCRSFADTILHEIIHMRQYRRRNWKQLPFYQSNAAKSDQRREQEYLGCSDEIDAYSFNIACELADKFKNPKDIADYISKTHRRGRLKSSSLRMYLKAFDYNTKHPIIRKLKKRVIGYVPNAELGKPYRNRDWICH